MKAISWNKLLPATVNEADGAVRSNIGVEVSLRNLNLVQLAQNKVGQIRVYGWASVPLNTSREQLIYDPKAFKTLSKEIRKHAAFAGKKINAMLPASELKIMSVNFETNEGQDAGLAIARIIADRVEGALTDYVIDYLPVRQSEKFGKGLAVVAIAKQDKVISYLDSLAAAGFEVAALDIGPAAIKRLVTALSGPRVGETVLVINFGSNMSYLSIISGRRLLFDEEIRFGEELLVAEIANALDMDVDVAKEQVGFCGLGSNNQAGLNKTQSDVADTLLQILRPSFRTLSDSLKRALVYAVAETRGEPISQIYLVGSVARWAGTAEVLTALMNLPVSVLPDPIATFGASFGEGEINMQNSHPDMALATGLALRDLDIDGQYRPGT